VSLAGFVACTDEEPSDDVGVDLSVGDLSAEDQKADGNWGAALTCKTAPNLPRLVNPKITLSINGLTLHLQDPATGFDKVYPVGAGAIEQDETSGEFHESLSLYPVTSTGKSDFVITPSSIQPCKTWWTDAKTGAKSPVFAGLPFMSFFGPYAIHGPIDNFRAANGGTLRRGYVSHGCFRMEAADVLEVYARIRGVARVPVHVQREAERLPDRTEVDLPAKWVGAECTADADCAYPEGFCAKNPLTQRGFCSAHCTGFCRDRAGYPSTFCVADPNMPGQGMCVAKAQSENFQCRPYDQQAVASLTRFGQPTVKANVCTPASPGWVGDHCRNDDECHDGTVCKGATATRPGVCTMSCDKACADQPGYADTFCTTVPAFGAGGFCMRQCTTSSNAAECPTDLTCAPRARNRDALVVKNVCLPPG
jgi:hypothetical protein